MGHDQPHEGGQVRGEGCGHEQPAVRGGLEGWPAEVEEWGDVIVNKVWTVLPDMMVPRSNHSLAVV